MISVVKPAWLDVKNIGQVNEITNATSLTKVESLLPDDFKERVD